MKHAREIKVALLAAVSLFLLYFGFNYLKGKNVFKAVTEYRGVYDNANGLVEQAAVFVRGYKVGQVEQITYDFNRDSAFTVVIAISNDIHLPKGTRMAMIQNGLLGGTAIELIIPSNSTAELYKENAILPTTVIPGMLDKVQGELMAKVGDTVDQLDSLVANVRGQLEGDHVKHILGNVDHISSDLTSVSKNLTVVSRDLKTLCSDDIPGIVTKVDTVLSDVNDFTGRLRNIDFESTLTKVDSVAGQANHFMATLDTTMVSVDSLVTDLKANPKRYVHFSLFGRKDDKK